MGAGREGKNIWWWLFTRWGNYAGRGKRWRGRDVFRRKWWRSPYIWHDSVGKFWNRWIGCKVLGHRKVSNVSDDDRIELHCFNCDRRVPDAIQASG